MSDVEFLRGDPVPPPYEPPPVPLGGPVPPGASAASSPPGPVSAPRRRFGPRSLTARLVTGIVALVVLLIVAIGITTYLTQRAFLYQRLDQQLGPIAAGNADNVSRCFHFDVQTCSIGDGPGNYRAPATEWVTQLNSDGSIIGRVDPGDSLELMKLSSGQARAIAANPEAVRTLTTKDGKVLRVTARSVGPVIVVSGLSTDELHRNLGRLIYVEFLLGVVSVALASLATAYGVRFTLRRLRRVTATAEEVAAELSPEGAGLDRRVPDDEPDNEIGQLATSFNTMLSAVQTQFAARVESERRMRQFLADASHELRTPLTSIRGFAELARMQRAVGDASDDNLDRIESEGTRMSRLVEDLLMLARGDADGSDRPAQRELIEVVDLVDDAVGGARAAFPDRRMDVETTGSPHIVGDRDQLVRVIRNLVTNAAVHTAAGRPILVRVFGAGGTATIQVADGGPGLPPDEAAHVFERFWRADKARTRSRGGSGLGLSIVATIVRAHGGTVRFDSSVEIGSTVTVTLPAAQPAQD